MTNYRLYLKACDGIGLSIYAASLETREECFLFCDEDNRCVVCVSVDRVEKIQHVGPGPEYSDIVDFYDQAFLLTEN